MQLPVRLEFDPILAGETEIRPLTITKSGGRTLSGNLTVSAPWKTTSPVYRVRAGARKTIELIFQPNESRNFVGQITLRAESGAENIIIVLGTELAGAPGVCCEISY